MTPDELFRALLDPTAPLPGGWPSGAVGAFLLFCVPIGGGIPLGVIMARNAGVSPAATAGLYFLSDILLAFTTEPFLILLRALSRRVPPLARAGAILNRLTGTAGLQGSGARGPFGLILVSFSISPTTGRAAAAAAGHGFIPGWTLAIIGDMAYFVVLMVSTLWVSSMFGDDRLTIGAVIVATWVIPMVIRRLRRRYARRPTPQPALRVVPAASDTVSDAATRTSAMPRRRVRHNGRRRASRGLRR